MNDRLSQELLILWSQCEVSSVQQAGWCCGEPFVYTGRGEFPCRFGIICARKHAFLLSPKYAAFEILSRGETAVDYSPGREHSPVDGRGPAFEVRAGHSPDHPG